MSAAVDNLTRDGFVRLGNFLSADEVMQLQNECARFMEMPAVSYEQYKTVDKHAATYQPRLYADGDRTIAVDLIGTSKTFDRIIEKVVGHPIVRDTLEAVLGRGYKLWQVNLRRHEPGSNGQLLHQDAPGELGLSLLVSDTPSLNGATVFLPHSHRWPINYSDVGLDLRPRLLRPMLSGATGAAGETSLFFNRTWHGRYPGQGSASTILISFFAVGASYPIHEPPPEVLASLGPELQRLLDPTVGVRRTDGNRVIVDGEINAPSALRYALRGVEGVTRAPHWNALRLIGRARRIVGRVRARLGVKLS